MPICYLRYAFVSAALSALVSAQDNPFLWTFNEFNLTDRSQISSCRELTVDISAMQSTFPGEGLSYYMIATELDGTPQTVNLGSNAQSMSWTMNHKPGSQVVLRIVDSDGNSGGSGPIYTISDGTLDCLKTDISSSFTISTNGTDTLNTCDPWGIRLTGGTPPYTINFVAPNSPSATNVTTLGNDDAYTYIDRAAPDDVLIAAASDATGRWASGTPHVRTQGSTDVKCNGLQSASGQSSDDATTSSSPSPIETEASSSDEKGSNKTAIVAGVVVPVTVILLALAAWFIVRRSKQQAKKQQEARSAVPYGSEGVKEDVNTLYSPSSSGGYSEPVMIIGSQIGKHSASERQQHRVPPPPTDSPTSSSSTAQLRVIPPTKAQQAGFHTDAPLSASDSPVSEQHEQQPQIARSELTRRPSTQQEVFQHTDVTETQMLELPPPYVGDRPPINL